MFDTDVQYNALKVVKRRERTSCPCSHFGGQRLQQARRRDPAVSREIADLFWS
jgi:hypothetical protein